MDIEKEFNEFIEFPSGSEDYVTSISAKLFAKHCVNKHIEQRKQWSKFDYDDESTYPYEQGYSLVFGDDIDLCICLWNGSHDSFRELNTYLKVTENVTFYQNIPDKPKE